MKIFLSALAIFISLSFFIPQQATAQTAEYAYVATDDTYLFADSTMEDTKKLFLLPKTYYVKILKKESSVCQVAYALSSNEYTQIIGYVKSSDILQQVPKTTPYHFIKKLEKKGNPILYDSYLDISQSGGQNVIMIDAAYYYGKIIINEETLYCVKYFDSIGYVKASDFNQFEVPNHPDYIPPTPPKEDNPTDPDNTNNQGGAISPTPQNNSLAEIIMIVAICIPAVIIVFLLFKSPKQHKSPIDVYRRNDYPPYDQDHYRD